MKVAVTFFAALMLTVQVAEFPLQSPDQLPRLALVPGVAVSTTEAFADSAAEQLVFPCPQFMPPADEVILPLPETDT